MGGMWGGVGGRVDLGTGDSGTAGAGGDFISDVVYIAPQNGVGEFCGILIVKPVDIGKDNEEIRVDFRGDLGRQGIVIAEA